MAFVCPSKEDSQRRRELMCNLQNTVDKIVCEEGNVPVRTSPCVPCCHHCFLPVSCPPSTSAGTNKCKPPDMMVCYKIKKCKTDEGCNKKEKQSKAAAASKVKPSKSRELRAGILYIGCDCEKRSGLQDDCQRSQCMGSPECLTKPAPTCGPSEFSNGKHLGKKLETKGAGDGGASAGDSKDTSDEYQCFPAVLDVSCFCP